MPVPPFLTEATYLGNTPLRWIIALLAGAAVYLALSTVRRWLIKRFAQRARENGRGFRPEDLLIALIGATRSWTLLAVGALVVLLILVIEPATALRLRQLITILLFIQVAIWGNRTIGYVTDLYAQNEEMDGGRKTSLAALSFVGRAVLYSLLLLVILDTLGIDVTALIAGLGVGSIAVALALQGLLGDLFASLSIVFDKPFEIGDFIVIDEFSGTVENIGLRTTRLRSLSGEQLVFANNDLLGSRIHNYKRMAERRVAFIVGVEYGTPKEKLERIPELIREAVEAIPETRFDRSHFSAFGAYSLDFETVYYVLSRDYALYMDVQQALYLRIYEEFEALGVSFAFPTQTIDLRASQPEAAPSAG